MGYPGVTVVKVQVEASEEDFCDGGGETMALSVRNNNTPFMDEFFHQVMYSLYAGCV